MARRKRSLKAARPPLLTGRNPVVMSSKGKLSLRKTRQR
jgi:hypothetical protein